MESEVIRFTDGNGEDLVDYIETPSGVICKFRYFSETKNWNVSNRINREEPIYLYLDRARLHYDGIFRDERFGRIEMPSMEFSQLSSIFLALHEVVIKVHHIRVHDDMIEDLKKLYPRISRKRNKTLYINFILEFDSVKSANSMNKWTMQFLNQTFKPDEYFTKMAIFPDLIGPSTSATRLRIYSRFMGSDNFKQSDALTLPYSLGNVVYFPEFCIRDFSEGRETLIEGPIVDFDDTMFPINGFYRSLHIYGWVITISRNQMERLVIRAQIHRLVMELKIEQYAAVNERQDMWTELHELTDEGTHPDDRSWIQLLGNNWPPEAVLFNREERKRQRTRERAALLRLLRSPVGDGVDEKMYSKLFTYL